MWKMCNLGHPLRLLQQIDRFNKPFKQNFSCFDRLRHFSKPLYLCLVKSVFPTDKTVPLHDARSSTKLWHEWSSHPTGLEFHSGLVFPFVVIVVLVGNVCNLQFEKAQIQCETMLKVVGSTPVSVEECFSSWILSQISLGIKYHWYCQTICEFKKWHRLRNLRKTSKNTKLKAGIQFQ